SGPVRGQPAAPAGRGLVQPAPLARRRGRVRLGRRGRGGPGGGGGGAGAVGGGLAGFKAGGPNGPRIENRSDREAVLLEVGSRRPTEDACDYPDIDMILPIGADRYFHRDGTPYPKTPRRT